MYVYTLPCPYSVSSHVSKVMSHNDNMCYCSTVYNSVVVIIIILTVALPITPKPNPVTIDIMHGDRVAGWQT